MDHVEYLTNLELLYLDSDKDIGRHYDAQVIDIFSFVWHDYKRK